MTDLIPRRYWNATQAARQLGISTGTIRYYIEYFGLSVNKRRSHRRQGDRLEFTNKDLAELWEIITLVKEHSLADAKSMRENKTVGANDIQYSICE